MPPPTHSIAAVPMADRVFNNLGTPSTSPRPIARVTAGAAFGEVEADIVELHDDR